MNKKAYMPPRVEVIEFELEEVIASSINNDDFSGGLTDDDIFGPGIGGQNSGYRTSWNSRG